jgi:hypothetical protein
MLNRFSNNNALENTRYDGQKSVAFDTKSFVNSHTIQTFEDDNAKNTGKDPVIISPITDELAEAKTDHIKRGSVMSSELEEEFQSRFVKEPGKLALKK